LALHPQDARRILLFTKPRYIGDTVVATPAMLRLREALTKAHICLATGRAASEAVQGVPFLDSTLVLPPKPGLQQTLETARTVRGGGYQMAVLFNRSLQSAVVAKLAGIPLRVGQDVEGRGLLLTHRARSDRTEREVMQLLRLIEVLGLPSEFCLPQLHVSPAEREEARDLLCRSGGDPQSAELLAVHTPGADTEKRAWHPSRYGELIRMLSERYPQLIPVHIGSAAERAFGALVEEAAGRRVLQLAGETSIRQMLGIVSLCRAVIAADGGVLHMSVGIGTPTVQIFGPLTAARWAYPEPPHRLILGADPLGGRDAAANRRALDSITPAMVVPAVQSVLELCRGVPR
jgi:ADP-heptose:LPS heptosyltransferase